MLIQREQLDKFSTFLVELYGADLVKTKPPEVLRFVLADSFFRLVELGGETLELMTSDKSRLKQIDESWLAYQVGSAMNASMHDHDDTGGKNGVF